MTPQAAYQFLKPSLEGLTKSQRKELARLIAGEPEPKEPVGQNSRDKRIRKKMRLLSKTGLFKN